MGPPASPPAGPPASPPASPPAGPPGHRKIAEIEVIAPNLKRRLSGVTATVHALVPLQARRIAIAATGPALPPALPQVPLGALLTMSRRGPSGRRVWHARRNVEMLAGLALRALGKDLAMVFTSASQREHTRLTRALIARMDAVVAVSGRSASYLRRPAQVIRHGVDCARFRPVADRAALRRRLGLDPDALIVGCYGRVRAQKGTGDFVAALAPLLADRPDVVAIAMGGTTGRQAHYRAELAAQIAATGLGARLRLLPEVPVGAMPDWYAALDLYVAPQRWEGFGLTVLEAAASGVPVVATRVGAFPELVADGRAGRLVPPGDVAALGAAVAALLDDRPGLAAMAAAARPHVLSQFRIEDEAAALVALYRRLIDA